MKLASLAVAAALFTGGLALPAMPAAAQNQRIIEVYGNDPCPSSNGGEIVVCKRVPDRERYRIPERLRTTEAPLGSGNSGVALAESTDVASRPSSGIDTCSPVGVGGQTGCWRQQARAAKAARKQANAEAPVIDGNN